MDLTAGAVIYGVPVYLEAGIDMAFEKLKQDGVITVEVINFSNSADEADKEKWALDFFKQNLLQQWFQPTLAPVTFDRQGARPPDDHDWRYFDNRRRVDHNWRGVDHERRPNDDDRQRHDCNEAFTRRDPDPRRSLSSSGAAAPTPAASGGAPAGGAASAPGGAGAPAGASAAPAAARALLQRRPAWRWRGAGIRIVRPATREVWAFPFLETAGRREARLDRRVDPETPGYDVQMTQTAESDQVTLMFLGGAEAPAVRIDGVQRDLNEARQLTSMWRPAHRFESKRLIRRGRGDRGIPALLRLRQTARGRLVGLAAIVGVREYLNNQLPARSRGFRSAPAMPMAAPGAGGPRAPTRCARGCGMRSGRRAESRSTRTRVSKATTPTRSSISNSPSVGPTWPRHHRHRRRSVRRSRTASPSHARRTAWATQTIGSH